MSFLGEWHMRQKALKHAEREGKMNASTNLRSYRGGRHSIRDAEEQKALKEAERHMRKNASNILRNYRGGEHDIKDHERVAINERKKNNARLDIEHREPDISAEIKRGKGDFHAGKSRQLFIFDFSFGLIYDDSQPEPGVDLCAQAAEVIIPYILNQWSNETNVFFHPKSPEVVGDISIDDWYESEDSTRYVVRGKVPIQVFVDGSAKDIVAPLQKVLKRYVSFQPISAKEVEDTTEERRRQLIIGHEGRSRWMRVRQCRLSGLGITF
ncbi:unnamed protein product [Pseudo-nitzschia multistriata]|uniref:Uncharacterized protein n=1 Tax=Pseudo-nitzschia multistriata TaxID=183589 RepID=A0A448ZD82_9STRA|nr:unnamed protein product [Pseudo-nitzschia multistriata]